MEGQSTFYVQNNSENLFTSSSIFSWLLHYANLLASDFGRWVESWSSTAVMMWEWHKEGFLSFLWENIFPPIRMFQHQISSGRLYREIVFCIWLEKISESCCQFKKNRKKNNFKSWNKGFGGIPLALAKYLGVDKSSLQNFDFERKKSFFGPMQLFVRTSQIKTDMF